MYDTSAKKWEITNIQHMENNRAAPQNAGSHGVSYTMLC